MMKRNRIIIIITLLCVLILIVAPFAGLIKISPADLKDIFSNSSEAKIFYTLRLPRVWTAFLAGAALAICGTALQAIFRNPLAEPFTLGISGGAAFGAAMYLIISTYVTICYGEVLFALIGALIAISLVYGLTKIKKGFSVGTMLLAGIAVNFFFSSLILFLQYISDFTQSFMIIRWLMGSINVVGFSVPIAMLTILLVAGTAIYLQGFKLNLMSISDEIAITRGVDVRATRKLIFLSTSVIVAAVVAFCGPVGFIGLMAPHITRLLVGSDHKILIPASMMVGGVVLTICDTIARTLIAPAEMPVGVIAAILGCPFFVWLLLKDEKAIKE